MSRNQFPTHYPVTHFDLGSLVVYSIVPWGTVPTEFDSFFWKDDRYPKGAGPFYSLRECMDNFKATLVIRDENPRQGNVIEVDFVRRKRL
jgi:hypothetical protein